MHSHTHTHLLLQHSLHRVIGQAVVIDDADESLGTERLTDHVLRIAKHANSDLQENQVHQ